MKTRSFILASAVVLMTACSQTMPKMGDNEYPVETIQSQTAAVQSTYPATLKGIQDVEIRPKVSGNITQVCVKEGQHVTTGQTLFVIDDVQYREQVRTAQAALNSAQAQLATAKLTYDNAQELHKQGITGDYNLSSAQNTYAAAQAAVAQATASLAAAKDNLSYCYVKSPASGVIGSLPYKVGALVSASIATALTTVSNDATMEVFFSMTEKEIMSMTKTEGGINAVISSFPTLKLQMADGTIYNHPGKVVKASGIVDATTGTVSVIAHFANPDHLLRSGGTGTIVVPGTSSSNVVIPQSATTEIQNKTFVYTVGKDNKVKYTEITVDPQNDSKNFIVTSGLKVGDRIVLKGLSSLSDGMEIKPITMEQYNKKVEEAEKLGSQQTDLKSFKAAMSK